MVHARGMFRPALFLVVMPKLLVTPLRFYGITFSFYRLVSAEVPQLLFALLV